MPAPAPVLVPTYVSAFGPRLNQTWGMEADGLMGVVKFMIYQIQSLRPSMRHLT